MVEDEVNAIPLKPLATGITKEMISYVPKIKQEQVLITKDYTIPEGKDAYIYYGYIRVVKVNNTGSNLTAEVVLLAKDDSLIKQLLEISYVIQEVIPGIVKQDFLDLKLNPIKLTSGEKISFIDIVRNSFWEGKASLSVFLVPVGTKVNF